MKRPVLLIFFLAALALTFGLKAAHEGWFAAREPLDLQGQAALLFFNKSKGCECELYVYNNANRQMDNWNSPVRVIKIDMNRRPDLVSQYQIVRAPTLVLLDANGEILWMQTESLSDDNPLDLEQVRIRYNATP